MDKVEDQRLRHIVAVADTGSFSRAALAQNITQPALSRSIAAFERQYGLVLFERGRSGAALTPAGKFVVDRAREHLRAADEFGRDLRLYREGAAGHVAFGMGPLLASLLLPELGTRILERSPKLEVETVVKSPDVLVRDLIEDRIEILVANTHRLTETAGLLVQPLGSIELCTVVRAGHPLLSRDIVTPTDLLAFPSARPVQQSRAAMPAGGFVCENVNILREIVLGSDCTCITGTAFVREDIAAGRLVPLTIRNAIMPDGPEFRSDVGLCTYAGRQLSSAARSVIELLPEALAAIDGR